MGVKCEGPRSSQPFTPCFPSLLVTHDEKTIIETRRDRTVDEHTCWMPLFFVSRNPRRTSTSARHVHVGRLPPRRLRRNRTNCQDLSTVKEDLLFCGGDVNCQEDLLFFFRVDIIIRHHPPPIHSITRFRVVERKKGVIRLSTSA